MCIKRHYKQSKKRSCRLGEEICKPYNQRSDLYSEYMKRPTSQLDNAKGLTEK